MKIYSLLKTLEDNETVLNFENLGWSVDLLESLVWLKFGLKSLQKKNLWGYDLLRNKTVSIAPNRFTIIRWPKRELILVRIASIQATIPEYNSLLRYAHWSCLCLRRFSCCPVSWKSRRTWHQTIISKRIPSLMTKRVSQEGKFYTHSF